MKLLITVEDGVSGKVTLRRDGHGHIVCDSDKVAVAAPAARESRREPKPEPAKSKPVAEVKPAKAKAAEEKPKAAEAEEKPKAADKPQKAKAGRPRRSSSLVWKPTTDAGFKGFVAKTDNGQFKLLKSKGSQWALFRERPDTNPEMLGCFKKEDLGRVAAQKAHDTPMKQRPVTEVTIVEVCPMPAGEDEDEVAAAPGKAPEDGTPAPSAELDKELMESLTRTLNALEDD